MRSFLFVAGLVFLSAVPSFSESLTLTTYYPAPAGAYKSLRSHNMCIGTTCTHNMVSDNNLYIQGNVGVGTTAPAEKLEVKGGSIKATDGLIVQIVAAGGVAPAKEGSIWLQK